MSSIFLSACVQAYTKELGVIKMNASTPRLQVVFENLKTVCFGRFIIDVPATATEIWGRSSVPLTVNVYPDGVDEIKAEAKRFINELNSGEHIEKIPRLISVDKTVLPEGEIVAGYSSFSSTVSVRINGYFRLNSTGVIISALPMSDRRAEATETIRNIARRVRHRNESEVPIEPGNCIEYGFLPDQSNMPKENLGELLEIGFRLKEFPDTHLSIAIRPAQRKFNESNTLEWQLERLERDLKAEDPNHIRLKTKYFRRGKRTIENWGDGFEALARSPEQPEIYSIHDFGMDFQGVGQDPLKPFINVQMQTGISDNEAGAAKPLLTDAEAIAVWDKITSTIRVRPTSATALGLAATDPIPVLPLGALVPTGHNCPQTGMWESSEAPAINGVQRRYLHAGDLMPRVAVRGEPSLWQKIKGQSPSYRMATIWKLVGYSDVSPPATTMDDTPSTGQGRPGPSAADKSADDGRSAEVPPHKNG